MTRPRSALITHYFPLVGAVVKRLPATVAQHWSAGDLQGFGTIGLIDAIDRHSGNVAVGAFPSYARSRIRGAIYDGLRQLDWLSRNSRRRGIELREAEDALMATAGRTPTRRRAAR